MDNHNNKMVVNSMGYEVGGVGYEHHREHRGGMGAAAFVLVLFILLVIILAAGRGAY